MGFRVYLVWRGKDCTRSDRASKAESDEGTERLFCRSWLEELDHLVAQQPYYNKGTLFWLITLKENPEQKKGRGLPLVYQDHGHKPNSLPSEVLGNQQAICLAIHLLSAEASEIPYDLEVQVTYTANYHCPSMPPKSSKCRL